MSATDDCAGDVPRHDELGRTMLETDYIARSCPVVLDRAGDFTRGDLLDPESLSEIFHDSEIALRISTGAESVSGGDAQSEVTRMRFGEYAKYVAEATPFGETGAGAPLAFLYASQIPFDPVGRENAARRVATPSCLPDRALMKGSSLWFGPSRTGSPTHFDESHNFLHQHYGSKRVRLSSPRYFETMRPGRKGTKDGHLSSRHAGCDTSDPDLAGPIPEMEAILRAGDVLFIPAYWWHRVEALDVSISVNYWWRAPIEECLWPAFFRTLSSDAVFRNPAAVAALVDLHGRRVDSAVCAWLARSGYTFGAAALCAAIVADVCRRWSDALLTTTRRENSEETEKMLEHARNVLGALGRATVIAPRHADRLLRILAVGEEALAADAPIDYSDDRRAEIRELLVSLDAELGDILVV